MSNKYDFCATLNLWRHISHELSELQVMAIQGSAHKQHLVAASSCINV